nr:hypothetical protein [Tanacetum cinerariifolium]
MKGSDIGEQEKKAKLFNEWKKFTSTDGKSIESYYHRFMQLMNDLQRNKYFPKNIASNLKFLNNLQPEWKRHVTIVRQTKNLHEADFTQIYDFLKMNQEEQGFNAWQNGRIQGAQNAGIANQSGTGNVVAARAEGTGIGNQARCYNCRGLGDLDEIEEVNANCILMANLQQASTSGTQHDRALFYDTCGSADVHLNDNCYDNEIFNMFTQEELYTDLLEPIPELQLVPQNDNHVTSVAPSMVHTGETLELAQESREKMRLLKKEIKPANYAKINHLSGSIMQNAFVDIPSDLRTELDRTKEKLELCIIKKEKEYAVLRNNWYTKCKECKYDNISYDKAYNNMQQKVERLQAQLRDLKGKSSNTPSTSNTLDPLNQKLESKILELEFQVVNYEREISHLKTTYKNLFDSIKSNRTHAKLHDLIFENATLRARLFKNTSESVKNTSGTSVTPHVDKPKLSVVTPHSKKLHASTQSHSVPQPSEFNVVRHRNVIAPGMFKINPSQTPRADLVPNKQSSASIRTNPITNSQRHVIVKENPKGNTRNAKVPSASKSSKVKKIVIVKDHRMTLLLSKNRKTMSSKCNNIKLAIRNDKSKIVCDTCKQCLVTANHDAYLTPFVNVLNSRANKLCANVPLSANQKRHRTQVWKPKQVGSKERLASKPRLPRLSLKWSPSRRSFYQKGKLVASKGTNCPNDDKAYTSNPQEPMRKQFQNSSMFLGRLSKFVCGYNDLKWGNIIITRVYFVEGLGHNIFSVGQFCDADLEVAFRRNTCFIRDLDGVDLLKGNRSINLYTINLYDMASASPICLMARATPTKSWLWDQRLSHLNFDTINDLAKNDLVSGLPKFKYAKEHLCPSCEQEKKQKSLTPTQTDDYSRYTWAHFLRIKDETPKVIKNFLKKIYVRLQAPVIIVRTDNGTEFKNQVLKEYFDSVGITHETSAVKTPQQNRVVERRNRTLVKASRTIVYNRRTRKIMETMNVTFDELLAMAFEQNSSRPGLQSMTSGKISSELELTYAPSTTTPQRPSERDLDILFEPLHNEY